MPVYEYQGVHYDISETDPSVAKSKILAHLGKNDTWGGSKPVAGIDRSRFQPQDKLFPGTNDFSQALSDKTTQLGTQLGDVATEHGASPQVGGVIAAIPPTVATMGMMGRDMFTPSGIKGAAEGIRSLGAGALNLGQSAVSGTKKAIDTLRGKPAKEAAETLLGEIKGSTEAAKTNLMQQAMKETAAWDDITKAKTDALHKVQSSKESTDVALEKFPKEMEAERNALKEKWEQDVMEKEMGDNHIPPPPVKPKYRRLDNEIRNSGILSSDELSDILGTGKGEAGLRGWKKAVTQGEKGRSIDHAVTWMVENGWLPKSVLKEADGGAQEARTVIRNAYDKQHAPIHPDDQEEMFKHAHEKNYWEQTFGQQAQEVFNKRIQNTPAFKNVVKLIDDKIAKYAGNKTAIAALEKVKADIMSPNFAGLDVERQAIGSRAYRDALSPELQNTMKDIHGKLTEAMSKYSEDYGKMLEKWGEGKKQIETIEEESKKLGRQEKAQIGRVNASQKAADEAAASTSSKVSQYQYEITKLDAIRDSNEVAPAALGIAKKMLADGNIDAHQYMEITGKIDAVEKLYKQTENYNKAMKWALGTAGAAGVYEIAHHM